MSFAFVPVYIHYVGIEAYGIIGFFVALQSLFAILDMGLSATLSRELARRSHGALQAQDTRDLVRTLEWICWPTGLAIAIVMWFLAGPIAMHWLQPVSLTTNQAADALVLLGLATALQWPTSFYTGGLSGMQQQVLLNVLTAGFASIRAVGAVAALWLIAPTLEVFLAWQILVSAVQSAVYARTTWRCLPQGNRRPSFNSVEIRRIGGFAAGITGVTIISFFLTQTDRIVLSKLLPLDEFGVYAFAASVAFALFKLVQPMVTAVYPRYCQLVAARNRSALIRFYHQSNQFMAVILIPAAAVGAAFARDILWLWTGDASLANSAAPILTLLVLGTAINGLLNLPASLQLAYGWTKLSLIINVISVFAVVPAVWLMGSRYGGPGAAGVWLGLHVIYVLVGIPLMHRRVLGTELFRWYTWDILPPLAASTAMVLIFKLGMSEIPRSAMGFAMLMAVVTSTALAALLASHYPRVAARDGIARWWPATWR